MSDTFLRRATITDARFLREGEYIGWDGADTAHPDALAAPFAKQNLDV